MADNNSNQIVNVMEIGQSLEDHVTMEVAPHSQVPMVIGVKSEKITSVNPTLLASLRKSKEGQMIAFTYYRKTGELKKIFCKKWILQLDYFIMNLRRH